MARAKCSDEPNMILNLDDYFTFGNPLPKGVSVEGNVTLGKITYQNEYFKCNHTDTEISEYIKEQTGKYNITYGFEDTSLTRSFVES